MADRRVTRSRSNELQARAGTQTHAQASFHQSNAHQQGLFRGTGMGGMTETEVKDTWGFFRNTSEELFLRSLVEGPMGIATPSMEGVGLTNLPQATKGNSEELFHNWILNVENQEHGQSYTPCRTRQASRRLSNELAALIPQQNTQTFHKVDSFDPFLQTGLPFLDNLNGDTEQLKSRNFDAEKGDQALEFSPLEALSWFQQPHPMTRSRSSELRRRYAAMQGLPVPPSVEMLQKQATKGPLELKNEVASLGELSSNVMMNGTLSQSHLSPQVPQNSVPFLGMGDSVSTMVSMLKETLERKKLAYQQQQQQQHNIARDLCSPQCTVQEELCSRSTTPQLDTTNREESSVDRDVHSIHNEAGGKLQTAGRMSSEGQIQLRGLANNCHVLSYAPSPSESSGGAPILSGCREDPWNSGQTTSNQNHENNLKRVILTSVDVNQQPKRQKSISNHPSLISNGPGFTVDVKEDPTKKRRVERQRKMAEAKGRISAPIIPSDLQAALKRCENLEKEVRSLKLNLSFMNRKDSEQTKQIEELQKQNEDLEQEKERLLEELDQLTQY